MHKPAIKSMFLFDPGHVGFEVDLKQADAQVVAWESHDLRLMELFTRMNDGEAIDVHMENAKVAYGPVTITPYMRQISKHMVHGTNYVGSAKTIAKKLGLLVRQVEVFQRRWFGEHPGIREWHRSVEGELAAKRSVQNIYGYRRYYFDRVEGLLPEAVAWIGQSTTACTINKGIRTHRQNNPEIPLLLQVHDSAVGQYPKHLHSTAPSQIKKNFRVTVPYDTPLSMGVDLKLSQTSWLACEKESKFKLAA